MPPTLKHEFKPSTSVPAPAVPAAMLPSAGQGSRPFAWANPTIASRIDSMARWVSAALRTSIWVERGIMAPDSGRNDHDPVVDRGGDSGPMLVDERRGAVCGGEVCAF